MLTEEATVFSLEDGEFTTIDHPDATSEPRLGTVLFGLNNRRQIVGQYVDTDLRLSRSPAEQIDLHHDR